VYIIAKCRGFIRNFDETKIYYTIIMTVRIISIDLGNKVSGVVVADSYTEEDIFVVLHLDVVKGDRNILDVVENDIIPEYVKGQHNCLLVLENIFMYRNFGLHAIHKKVKKLFTALKCKVKCLLPSQKSCGNGGCLKVKKGENRKEVAYKGACGLLKEVLGDMKHYELFMGFKPRRHDLADALLAAYYIHEHSGSF
jgi:hypothetical protein